MNKEDAKKIKIEQLSIVSADKVGRYISIVYAVLDQICKECNLSMEELIKEYKLND